MSDFSLASGFKGINEAFKNSRYTNKDLDLNRSRLLPVKQNVSTNDESLNASLNVFKYINPNLFENKIDRSDRSRRAFLASITNPVEYLKEKNVARDAFQTSVLGLRKTLYETFLGFGVAPALGEHLSSMVAERANDALMEVLDSELYPSQLEDEIYENRLTRIKGEFGAPLKGGTAKAYSRYGVFKKDPAKSGEVVLNTVNTQQQQQQV
jgi:hypothetical protein